MKYSPARDASGKPPINGMWLWQARRAKAQRLRQ